MRSGVYAITAPSGKKYIGSAVDFSRRWAHHRFHLRRGQHVNKALQAAWVKYGEDGLVFSKVVICERKDVLLYEQLALDALKPEYNVLTEAGHSTGWKHSDETREQFSVERTGKVYGPCSEERKQKISAAQKGRPLSEEHKQKLKEASPHRKVVHTEDTRNRIAETLRGVKHSEERKAKRLASYRATMAARKSGLS